MNIIIAGTGDVVFYLSKLLAQESHNIVIIEHDKKVGKIKKFRKQSPGFIFGNRCFYVGQSAKAPMLRFKQHKEGYKSNTYAKRFGLRLAP